MLWIWELLLDLWTLCVAANDWSIWRPCCVVSLKSYPFLIAIFDKNKNLVAPTFVFIFLSSAEIFIVS